MNARKIWCKLACSILVVVPHLLTSCESIRDDRDHCGIYLEFIYDYNMDYTDVFDLQVDAVDVFLFDGDGRYLLTKRSRRENLSGGNRMFLGDDIPYGKYKILAIGGLSPNFRVSGRDGSALTAGQTMLGDVRIALAREGATVADEFSPLWVGEVTEVEHKPDLSVWPVHLIKDTNRFSLVLSKPEDNAGTRAEPAYTFSIVTPEGAVYGADNAPVLAETVTYTPYLLAPGDDPEELAKGQINTVRLIDGKDYPYRITVQDTRTGRTVWDYDLMELLEAAKPGTRPDGNALPMQEYLDRRSEWRIVIHYKEGDDGGFVAFKVIVNDWIIWLNEIGV